jgi:hypothetical protein
MNKLLFQLFLIFTFFIYSNATTTGVLDAKVDSSTTILIVVIVVLSVVMVFLVLLILLVVGCFVSCFGLYIFYGTGRAEVKTEF